MAKQAKALKTKAGSARKRGAAASGKAGGPGSRKRNAVTAQLSAVEGRGAQKIEWWPVEKTIPYPANAKSHNDEQVKQIASGIADLGFNNPILVDGKGVILAGHGRRKAALLLEMERVPVVVLDHLSAVEARRYRFEDNYYGMLSGWDEVALRAELTGIRDDDGIDLSALGLDEKALAAIFKSGGFLNDMIGGEGPDTNDGMRPPARGVSLKFDMLPGDRDAVVTWLGQQRDRLKLRTSGEALVALAKHGLKKA